MDPSRASLPPAEPRPLEGRPNVLAIDAAGERPAIVQMLVALLLGFMLVAIPLYLWRRPRTVPEPSALEVTPQPASLAASGGAAGSPPPGPTLPILSAPSVLDCHDKGPKRVADCDHPAAFEKALSDAILASASCLGAAAAGGGTVEYVLEIGYAKKHITLTAPKDARTVHGHKGVAACVSSIRRALAPLDADFDAPHAHTRYRVAVTATYGGS